MKRPLGAHPQPEAPRAEHDTETSAGKAHRRIGREQALIAGNPKIGAGPQDTTLGDGYSANRRSPHCIEERLDSDQAVDQFRIGALFKPVQIKACTEMSTSANENHRVDQRVGDALRQMGEECLH